VITQSAGFFDSFDDDADPPDAWLDELVAQPLPTTDITTIILTTAHARRISLTLMLTEKMSQ
jgi:hypothetical protein